jgi:hypothetical protein
MKQYSVDIQVDFDKPREIPPLEGHKDPARAVGYFRYFYCSAGSKDEARRMALEFTREDEAAPERCRFKCERIAWMRGLTSRDQLVSLSPVKLTEEMFEQRHNHGIWWDGGKEYYVSEADAAASLTEGDW